MKKKEIIEQLTVEKTKLRLTLIKERAQASEEKERSIDVIKKSASFGIVTMRECDDYRDLLVKLSCMTPKAAAEEIKTAVPAVLKKWDHDEEGDEE